jgi:hypothetical protein
MTGAAYAAYAGDRNRVSARPHGGAARGRSRREHGTRAGDGGRGDWIEDRRQPGEAIEERIVGFAGAGEMMCGAHLG